MAQKQDLDRMCPVGQEAALGTKLDALITLANELRTDHGTNRTFQLAVETLIEELHDDHATVKTSTDELIDDHATTKTAVDETKTLIDELHDDHATTKTAVDETKTLVDELHDDHTHGKQAGFSGRCDNSGSGYSVDIIMGRVPVH